MYHSVADNNPFRYNGQYYDDDTGLIYLRNRYYDPSIGRFTQEDPAKDGLNWYVYCGNDPVNMFDIFGLEAVPLRATAESLGAVVTYDSAERRVVVDFGYYGGWQYYTLNGNDDDGAFGQYEIVNGEVVIVAMIEEGRIESDFGIVDNEWYYDESIDTLVTVSLFDKGYQGYYQRIAMNGASVTWEQVNYSNFNATLISDNWKYGRFVLAGGQVEGNYLTRENHEVLNDVLAFMDAYPSEMPYSEFVSVASYISGLYYRPSYLLSTNDYQVVFHNKVYFFDRNLNYKYTAKAIGRTYVYE